MAIEPEGQVTRRPRKIEIAIEGDAGIVLWITSKQLEIRIPTVVWTGGTHSPVQTTRPWQVQPWSDLTQDRLQQMLVEAKEIRRSEFARCRFCGNLVPVEHRHDDVCHGCAEQHLGIVH